jgi:hypothetical protein
MSESTNARSHSYTFDDEMRNALREALAELCHVCIWRFHRVRSFGRISDRREADRFLALLRRKGVLSDE